MYMVNKIRAIGIVIVCSLVLVACGGSSNGSSTSGSGGISPQSSSDANVAPAEAVLLGFWDAAANQPGSGLTYTGIYNVLAGGRIQYDISISNGQHFVGSGSWDINGFKFRIHTDPGSLYVGDFIPGNYQTITMNANTGWNLALRKR